MSNPKTTTLSFRIEPGLKEGLRMAAELEHRSIANMIEVLIRDYCGRHGIMLLKSHSHQAIEKTIYNDKKDDKHDGSQEI